MAVPSSLLSLASGIAGVPCKFSTRQSVGAKKSSIASAGRSYGVPKVRAQAGDDEAQSQADGAAGGDDGGDEFEARLARLQRKVTSGSGKKAEARKARKEGVEGSMMASSKPAKGSSVFIPPVSLKDPVSDGLVVELGMKPYTERLNGRLAALGLAAVLLVELATGQAFVQYHESGTLIVQVYTVLGLAALYVKYEKEKISVWPKE